MKVHTDDWTMRALAIRRLGDVDALLSEERELLHDFVRALKDGEVDEPTEAAEGIHRSLTGRFDQR